MTGRHVFLVSLFVVTALLGTSLGGAAQVLITPANGELPGGPSDPLAEYYQFRHSSALPGMLFGVTPEGRIHFSGAFQQNIPVAYTPAEGNWVAGGNSGSTSSSIEIGFSGARVNGTAFAGAGWLDPGHGLFVSWMATGTKIEEAWNLQYQIRDGFEGRTAVALGVQDLFNERERYIKQSPHNARSLYLTATGPLKQATWRPLYWTAGWGNGRFRRGFAGLSLPINDHWRGVVEYDSFNVNAGVAWALNGADTERDFDLIGYFGMTRLKRPVVGLTLTYF